MAIDAPTAEMVAADVDARRWESGHPKDVKHFRRRPRFRRSVQNVLAALIAATSFLHPRTAAGEPVRVRYAEGSARGFLVLSDLDGARLADGDLIQAVRGTRVTSRIVFRFKDGSLYDETAVFSQLHRFRLLSHRVVQKGPSFPQPLETSIDAVTGHVTVRYHDSRGRLKVDSERLDLPPDLANGVIQILLKNVRPDALPKAVRFVAATPKPRLVKLAITAAGEEPFSTGGTARRAMHYVLKVDIGGIAGLVAPLLGKQPPDSHVWILSGDAPALVRAEQALYIGGPIWRIELVSPVWPHEER